MFRLTAMLLNHPHRKWLFFLEITLSQFFQFKKNFFCTNSENFGKFLYPLNSSLQLNSIFAMETNVSLFFCTFICFSACLLVFLHVYLFFCMFICFLLVYFFIAPLRIFSNWGLSMGEHLRQWCYKNSKILFWSFHVKAHLHTFLCCAKLNNSVLTIVVNFRLNKMLVFLFCFVLSTWEGKHPGPTALNLYS